MYGTPPGRSRPYRAGMVLAPGRGAGGPIDPAEVNVAETAAIPDYQEALGAYHAAFAAELRSMLAGVPVPAGARVLDMACGDGSYSAWLAELVGEGGRVVAVDALPAYLDLARATISRPPAVAAGRVALVAGAIERLPFAPGSFDLVWCAQSLYSLPEPAAALRRLAGMARPGGTVAVLENDSLHHVILPWPVELELAVRRAELESFVARSAHPRKFYVARQLGRLFREAGLENCRVDTRATDRRGPLAGAERAYFAAYLAELREHVAPYLDKSALGRLDHLADPGSPGFLLDDPDLNVTCIDHVVRGSRPMIS